MKKSTMKKLVVFTALFLFVLVGTMKFTTKAGSIKPDNVTVDYVNETVTVITDSDEIVYYTDRYVKDTEKWDACEVRERTTADGTKEKAAVFDISWVSPKKTVRLYLCGDVNTEVIAVDITWEESFSVAFTGTLFATDITEVETWKKVYAKYPNFSEDTGYFIFTMEENGREMAYFPGESLDTIQWRKGEDGVWRTFRELDLKEMNIRGIDLEFRVVADAEDRASSTEKISVAKLNSAPNVFVNPDLMKIDIKNGMEFSFDRKTWVSVPAYNKKFGLDNYLVPQVDREVAIEEIYTNQRIAGIMMQLLLKTQVADFKTNSPMDRESLEAYNQNGQVFEFTEKGIVLYVRESGTNRKAASKIAEVIIPYAAKETAVPPVSGTEGVDTLEFSYGKSKTNTGGIVLDNKTKYKYQVGVITVEEAENMEEDDWQNLDFSNVSWTGIRADRMLKISNKKAPKGSYLLYRIAGEDGNLPSTYQIYGPLNYDHITYAGIAKETVMAGKSLTAVPSTNFEPREDGTYEFLTFQWQSCPDVKADTPEWTNLGEPSNNPTYELTNEVANHYIRVVIYDNHDNAMESDYVGPVKQGLVEDGGTEE